MEVRKGYKQTEIGILPENWEVKKLGELTSLRTGPFGSSLHKSDYITNGIPLINPTHIFDGELFPDRNITVSKEAVMRLSEFQLRTNDIILGRRGEMGRCAVVKEAQQGWLCGSGSLIMRPNTKIVPEFLRRIISSPQVIAKIEKSSVGSTMINLNQAVLFGLKIQTPPLLEQNAIAAALSDVDVLLNSLDALIAKKRLIKQGAMQELLTGKKRLPGFEKKKGYKQTASGVFPADWDIVLLKQISSMHGRIGWQGLKQTEFTMNSEQPFLITGMNFKDGDIRWGEVYHVPWDRYEMAKEIQLKTGDVLMTKDGTIGKILFVDGIPYPGKATLNSHLLVFRPLNNKYNPKFLFYQLNSKTFFNHVEQEKSGTTFFGITQEAVGKYNAFLPSVPEQTAIAKILSDMDAEIAALEQKREKTRLLKQGMMQELLTGRIRLV